MLLIGDRPHGWHIRGRAEYSCSYSPATRLLQDIPVCRTLLPGICSSRLVLSKYIPQTYCKLDSPTRNVTLSSLRELGLFKCAANDEAIRDIVAGCPLIECLKIIDCRGLKSLEFLKLGKLSKFMVREEEQE